MPLLEKNVWKRKVNDETKKIARLNRTKARALYEKFSLMNDPIFCFGRVEIF